MPGDSARGSTTLTRIPSRPHSHAAAPAQCSDRLLARAVRAERGEVGADGRTRSHVHDRAPALQVRVTRAHEAKGRERTGAPPHVEELFGDLGERPEGRDLRVVHEDVDGAVLGDGAVDARLDLSRVGHVALERRRDTTALGDGRHRALDLGAGAAGGDDLGARLGQRERNALADPLARAGDDRYLAVERTHRSPRFTTHTVHTVHTFRASQDRRSRTVRGATLNLPAPANQGFDKLIDTGLRRGRKPWSRRGATRGQRQRRAPVRRTLSAPPVPLVSILSSGGSDHRVGRDREQGLVVKSDEYRPRIGYDTWILKRTERSVASLLYDRLRDLGLTPSQYGALQVLIRLENGIVGRVGPRAVRHPAGDDRARRRPRAPGLHQAQAVAVVPGDRGHASPRSGARSTTRPASGSSRSTR